MTSLHNHTILFLSLPRHDGDYNSTPWQIASRLARANKVFFADHPPTFLDAVTGFWKPAMRKRMLAYFHRHTVDISGVTVIYAPFVWPVNFLAKGKLYAWMSALNHRILGRRINRVLKKHRVDSYTYVNSFDFYFPYLDRYLCGTMLLKVYHCIDPIIKSYSRRHGVYLEEELARRSHVVIATAPALQRRFNGKSFLVANGVDEAHFGKPATGTLPLHHVREKVVGYLGNIERRIDFTLLIRILTLLPDWHLVMAGPVEAEYIPATLRHHSRVTFTGPIAYNQVPAALQTFDVAIIPFLCDEASAGVFPLKLYEYLAAGKPVVSTPFNPEILQPLGNVVYCADNAEAFAENIAQAYVTNTPAQENERIRIAANNTWHQRTALFAGILAQHIQSGHRHVD